MSSKEISKVEEVFEYTSVVAALLVLPAVFLQVSGSKFAVWGEVLSVGIWVYFVVEIVVMLQIEPDNLAWIKSHLVEFGIVLASCPLLLFLVEDQNVFALAPIIAMTRIFRIFKFAKLVKIAKVDKSHKIIREDLSIPLFIEVLVGAVVLVLTMGILGMVVHEEAHSLPEGLNFWLRGLSDLTRPGLPVLLLSAAAVVYVLYRAREGAKSSNGIHSRNPS